MAVRKNKSKTVKLTQKQKAMIGGSFMSVVNDIGATMGLNRTKGRRFGIGF